MLMQMPGPKDIVVYWTGPQAFSVEQKPGAENTFRCKSPPGGMVTGQIDNCITDDPAPQYVSRKVH